MSSDQFENLSQKTGQNHRVLECLKRRLHNSNKKKKKEKKKYRCPLPLSRARKPFHQRPRGYGDLRIARPADRHREMIVVAVRLRRSSRRCEEGMISAARKRAGKFVRAVTTGEEIKR